MEKLHAAHSGVQNMMYSSKQNVYWNGMRRDLENLVDNCEQCKQYARSPWRPPPTERERPSGPWQFLSSDLFYFEGSNYLLTSDQFSKFPIVNKISSDSSSESIISRLMETFSNFGIPLRLYTDNGPQYSSPAFAKFSNEWEFEHITSSPQYPESNRYIERQVQNIKNILKKTNQADRQLALLALRHTPINKKVPSPMHIMFNRSDPNNLEYLKHVTPKPTLKDTRRKSEPEPFIAGQNIRLKSPNNRIWEKGIIVRKQQEPHSYDVEGPSGRHIRRTHHHLRGAPHIRSYPPRPTIPLIPQVFSTPLNQP